jgi:large subunit ribosomal protein L23
VFGPLPKDYDVRLPQSKRRAAMRAALAWKLRDGLVHVVEEPGTAAASVRGWLARRLARRRRARQHMARAGARAPAATSRRQGRAARAASTISCARHPATRAAPAAMEELCKERPVTHHPHAVADGEVPRPERHNQVAFRACARRPRATQAAVERIFKAKVAAVNVVNMPGKEKRLGKNIGRRSDWKKAIVTLKPGEKIEIIEGVS